MKEFAALIQIGETLDGPLVPEDLSDILNQGDGQLGDRKALLRRSIDSVFNRNFALCGSSATV
jgi:hypothetical protein